MVESSILSGMEIFTDRGYIIISIMGSVLSMLGTLHQMAKVFHKKTGKKFNFWYFVTELIRALVIGFLLTPLIFILYMHGGSRLIEFLTGFDGANGIVDSFWFMLTLISAWFAPVIWNAIMSFIVRKYKKMMERV